MRGGRSSRFAARVAGAIAPLAAAVFVVGFPRLVEACAVCTSGREDENNTAFLISTIFLSLLPLAGLGTLVFVIWRRLRALEAQGRGAESAPIASASVASSIPAP
ncbi:MAG: hypothetical protein U0900_24180 [Myxococcota bacterium]